MVYCRLCLLVAVVLTVGCGEHTTVNAPQIGSTFEIAPGLFSVMKEAQRQSEGALFATDDIQGIAICEDEQPFFRIYLKPGAPEPPLPSPISRLNLKVEFAKIPRVKALARPQMGTSTANDVPFPYTGTLGAVVTRQSGTVTGYVTNNHVAAAQTQFLCPNSILNDVQFAPSLAPRSPCGVLHQPVPPIDRMSQSNVVDAAFVDSQTVDPTYDSLHCSGFCPAPGITPLPLSSLLRQDVWKCGAMSHLKKGVVRCFNATVDVEYEGCYVARFVNQLQIDGTFAVPGDSGSVVYARTGAVGLLFSGDGVSASFANPIREVLAKLNANLPAVPCGQPNFP